MLGVYGVELATEFAQRGLGLSDAQVARLLERGERVIDARDGLFIRVDIEVSNGVVDELSELLVEFIISESNEHVQCRDPRRATWWA